MKKLLTFFLAMIASITLMAQVTTSSISGKIVDESGPLPGATIIATHVPSGTSYGTTTNSEGRYTMQGMRVGGPYTIEVRFVGYKPSKVEGVCDVCGGKTIQRSDDNPETVQSRLDTYRKNTAPLIDFYAARGLIVEGNNNVSSETCIAEIEAGLSKLGL